MRKRTIPIKKQQWLKDIGFPEDFELPESYQPALMRVIETTPVPEGWQAVYYKKNTEGIAFVPLACWGLVEIWLLNDKKK